MGTIKMIIGIVAILAAIIACAQVAPPEVSNLSFQEDLKEIAVLGSANQNKTEDDLRVAVMNKARDHNIPLNPDQITIQRIGSAGMTGVYIGVDYTVQVNLPGYSFVLHFTPNSGNK